MSFKFDAKKFKKVGGDKDHTILQHAEGHTLHVAHKALSPDHRAMLQAIPMSDGGEVKKPEDSNMDKGMKSIRDAFGPKQPKPKPAPQTQPMADGGPVKPIEETLQEAGVPPLAAQAEAAPSPDSMPQVDPIAAQKQALYNQQVSAMKPDVVGGMSTQQVQPGEQFGAKGEQPETFNADAWKKAEDKFKADEDTRTAQGQQIAAKATEENAVRQRAGLAPLPLPPGAVPAADRTPQGQIPATGQPEAPKSPTDPYGTEAYYNAYTKGLGEQKAGMQQQALAEQQQGKNTADLLAHQVEQQNQQVATFQSHVAELNKEREAFIKDVQNSHIDPEHYMSSMDTGGKISTAIGLILGGLGGGLSGGGGNQALTFLNSQIDRDVNAQKAELGKKENLLSANMKQFGNLRDATDMTRVMQMDVISNQMKQEAAKAQGPLAKARLLQAAGQLDQQAAPILSQMAMRKTLLSGMKSGQSSPEQVIRMVVPEHQQKEAYNELKEAQTVVKAKDRILGGYDQLTKLQTVGSRVSSPVQSGRQIDAIIGSIVPGLSKETAGKFTEEDAKFIDKLMPRPGNTDETNKKNRAALTKLITEKMHFPQLKAYGIDLSNHGLYDITGKPKVNAQAPVIK